MPSVFDRQFKQSGFPLLLQNYGEPVVYHFRGGGSRSFNAIIEREPNAIYDASGNAVLPEFVIRFYNHCTNGVLASEIDTGGDEVEIINEIGDVISVRKAVMKMMSQDSGIVQLALK